MRYLTTNKNVMKHIFVVNPKAGGKDESVYIVDQLKNVDAETEVYVTRGPRDATRFVAERCAASDEETLRFYACGGDGTLNEVVSGVMGVESGERRVRRVEVGCYPCGSGNDFVKNWPEADFHNMKSLLEGEAVDVDVMRFCANSSQGGSIRYSLNTLNFGFEAAVCRTMSDVRRKPIIGGRMAYTTGIVKSLATGRRNYCRVEVDGELWHDEKLLLLSLANGQYAGGGYHCAPRAVVDDGQIEMLAVKPMSIASFARLIKYYENGELIERPELRKVVSYRRGQRVTIEAGGRSFVATDGELVEGARFEIEVLPKALRFVVPSLLTKQ